MCLGWGQGDAILFYYRRHNYNCIITVQSGCGNEVIKSINIKIKLIID